jgi:AraC-like DNA-binding protein
MSGLIHPAVEQSLQSTRQVAALPIWQLERVMEFIEANIHQSFHTCDLAAIVNLSAPRFAILFRRATGESPLAYLRHRRIERAQEMMRVSDEPLAEIALACGLADQSHLTKLFRRLVGSSPAAWRREQRAAAWAHRAASVGVGARHRKFPSLMQPARNLALSSGSGPAESAEYGSHPAPEKAANSGKVQEI